jgi:hypothetical protein
LRQFDLLVLANEISVRLEGPTRERSMSSTEAKTHKITIDISL